MRNPSCCFSGTNSAARRDDLVLLSLVVLSSDLARLIFSVDSSPAGSFESSRPWRFEISSKVFIPFVSTFPRIVFFEGLYLENLVVLLLPEPLVLLRSSLLFLFLLGFRDFRSLVADKQGIVHLLLSGMASVSHLRSMAVYCLEEATSLAAVSKRNFRDGWGLSLASVR